MVSDGIENCLHPYITLTQTNQRILFTLQIIYYAFLEEYKKKTTHQKQND